jgi:hypothetical protein
MARWCYVFESSLKQADFPCKDIQRVDAQASRFKIFSCSVFGFALGNHLQALAHLKHIKTKQI